MSGRHARHPAPSAIPSRSLAADEHDAILERIEAVSQRPALEPLAGRRLAADGPQLSTMLTVMSGKADWMAATPAGPVTHSAVATASAIAPSRAITRAVRLVVTPSPVRGSTTCE